MRSGVARAVVLALTLCAWWGPEAGAGLGDGGIDRPVIIAVVEYGSPSAGTRPVKSSPLRRCVFRASLSAADTVGFADQVHVLHKPSLDEYDPAGLYHLAVCRDRLFGGRFWTSWPVGDPVPLVVVDAVGRVASDAAPLPLLAPQTSPGGTRDFPLLVNMETWFWADEGLWGPVQATATIVEFGLTVTATATPVGSVWDPGDGSEPVTCVRGTEWSKGAGESTDCGHKYARSTQTDGNSNPFVLSATVTWDVTYTCVPAVVCTGPPNVPGVLVTEVSRPVWVTQVKGILTG